jgi:NAD(P)H-dependent flavin oxidoreductase YrpB (nitropropane dioxygenase family)
MFNRLSRLLGTQYPIIGFSHCRDVVIEISKAGGIGVFGCSRFTNAQLTTELSVIEADLHGLPFGVDVLFPVAREAGRQPQVPAEPDDGIPEDYRSFVTGILRRHGVEEERVVDEDRPTIAAGAEASDERSTGQLEVALRYHPRLVVSALGPMPTAAVAQVKSAGALVGGMVGSPRHTAKHIAVGTDLIIAVGTEAAGHAGPVSTMVLVPQIVAGAQGVPVVAAGGIGSGAQLAAALALGAEGGWLGSLWLTTTESDTDPIVVDKLLSAGSADTLQTRCLTGKPSRQLKTAWTDAWHVPGALPPLAMPKQGALTRNAVAMIEERRIEPLMGSPAGQVIGQMHSRKTVRDVMFDLVSELADTIERIGGLIDAAG